MDIEIPDKDLERLVYDGSRSNEYPPQVVRKLWEVVTYLQLIENRLSIYNWKGLRFEKYEGDDNKHTVRLSRK